MKDTAIASFGWPCKADTAHYSEDIPPKPQHSWTCILLWLPFTRIVTTFQLESRKIRFGSSPVFYLSHGNNKVLLLKHCARENSTCFPMEKVPIHSRAHILRKPLLSHTYRVLLESQLVPGYRGPGKNISNPTKKSKPYLDNRLFCLASGAQRQPGPDTFEEKTLGILYSAIMK